MADPLAPAASVAPGRYRHYKGGEYEVLGVATHSEFGTEHVVYRSVEDGAWWVRPSTMFVDTVRRRSGLRVPRFRLIEEAVA